MDFMYTWLALAVIFIILELLTATFYGLSLALASIVTGIYVYFSWETLMTLNQWIIFVIASAIFAYFLPKYLVSDTPDMPQGVDQYIGEKRNIKKVWWDLKISLDGVDYLIESDDDISAWDKVEIIGHKGASMKVKKVSK
jgi:membrane protein implicated in regulation of membrane protease activity